MHNGKTLVKFAIFLIVYIKLIPVAVAKDFILSKSVSCRRFAFARRFLNINHFLDDDFFPEFP